jgi:hypothetical protein
MGLVSINLNLSDKQKKIVVWAIAISIVFGGGFFSGIKFNSMKLDFQIGKYKIDIEKMAKQVADKDLEIKNALSIRDAKDQEATLAKQAADQAGIQADEAEKKYRTLEASISGILVNSTPTTGSGPVNASLQLPQPTVIEVAKDCDDVIAKKDVQIKGLSAAYANVFDAKAAADQAITSLQANESTLKKELDLKDKIDSDLNKELESQKRQHKLYLIGGFVLGGFVGHAITK